MALYLAVDAGGTKTDYLLADGATELARVRGHSIKRLRVSAKAATAHLDAALGELQAGTGVPLHLVRRTCVGTAGNTVPLVRDWLRSAFAERVGGELLLMGDVEIALDAAFPGGAGVLALAGTGSNVAGRGSDGVMTTAGGWGPALGDEGSGHRIGHEALRALFRARDAGRPTALFDAALHFWQLASEADLVEHANRTLPPDFSSLTAIVLRCAEQGDEVAREVLRQQGEELGLQVSLVLRRLLRNMPSAEPPPLAFAGSILENVAPVRESLVNFVRAEFPGLYAMPGVIDPLQGALWRARKADLA